MRPKSSLVVPYFSMWARAAMAISCDGATTPAAYLNCMSHGQSAAAALRRAVEPDARTTVEGAVADDAVGDAGRERERRLPEHRERDAAAVELVDVEAQALDADRLRQDVRRDRVVDAVRAEAVDVGEREAGVGDRGLDRSRREREDADARVRENSVQPIPAMRHLRPREPRGVAHVTPAPCRGRCGR